MEILGLIVFGAVIGLLGKWVAPSHRDNIPLWLTVICGIGGALLGYWLWGDVLGKGDTAGIDWIRWIISIAAAAVLVMIAAAVTAGRGKKPAAKV